MTDADFMRLAIQAAWQGLGKGEMPFGACIVRKEQVLSVSHNSAKANIDTTPHAEVQAIREASRQLRMLELAGCVIYSTCEPCPVFYRVSVGQARADCLCLSHRGRGKGRHPADSHFIESDETIRTERRSAL